MTAEQLGDHDLRAAAFCGRSLVAYHAGRFDEALELGSTAAGFRRRAEGSRAGRRVLRGNRPGRRRSSVASTPRARCPTSTRPRRSHSLPTIGCTASRVRAELEELGGEWETLRGMTPRIEQTVAENLQHAVRSQ